MVHLTFVCDAPARPDHKRFARIAEHKSRSPGRYPYMLGSGFGPDLEVLGLAKRDQSAQVGGIAPPDCPEPNGWWAGCGEGWNAGRRTDNRKMRNNRLPRRPACRPQQRQSRITRRRGAANLKREHLNRYVSEFATRHNMRPKDTERMMTDTVASMVGKRLLYRDLVR